MDKILNASGRENEKIDRLGILKEWITLRIRRGV